MSEDRTHRGRVATIMLVVAVLGLVACGERSEFSSAERAVEAAFERGEFTAAVGGPAGVEAARLETLLKRAAASPARELQVLRWLASDAPTDAVESSVSWVLFAYVEAKHEEVVRTALARASEDAVAKCVQDAVEELRSGPLHGVARLAECLARLPPRSIPGAIVEAMTLANASPLSRFALILKSELRNALRAIQDSEAHLSSLVGLATKRLDLGACGALGMALCMAVRARPPTPSIMRSLIGGADRDRSIAAAWAGPLAFESSDALGIAERLSTDSNAELRETLAMGLGQSEQCTPAVEQILLRMAGDASEDVRSASLWAMGAAHCQSAVSRETLVRLAQSDPVSDVRSSALRSALSVFSDQHRTEAITVLRAALTDGDLHVRIVALDLCAVEGLHDQVIVEVWAEALARAPDSYLARSVASDFREQGIDVTDEVVGLLTTKPGVSRLGVLRALDALKARRPDLRTELAAELASPDEETARLAQRVVSPP